MAAGVAHSDRMLPGLLKGSADLFVVDSRRLAWDGLQIATPQTAQAK
jgi:hypothetical protein